jgi:GNAT superfamily N-acetyltransferase
VPPTVPLVIRIRPVGEGDLLGLTEMLSRCSEQTRYRRFHGFVRAFPERYLADALKGGPAHVALVAETPDRIVALASCVTGDDGTREIGILVEDAYQRRRIGTRLLETLLAHAAHAGQAPVQATIQYDQTWMVPLLRRYEQIKIIYQ